VVADAPTTKPLVEEKHTNADSEQLCEGLSLVPMDSLPVLINSITKLYSGGGGSNQTAQLCPKSLSCGLKIPKMGWFQARTLSELILSLYAT